MPGRTANRNDARSPDRAKENACDAGLAVHPSGAKADDIGTIAGDGVTDTAILGTLLTSRNTSP